MEDLFHAEQALWDAVTSGDSLAQHLEDAYLVSLRECVRQRSVGGGAERGGGDADAQA